ncbi:hypothetical protein GCM10027422_29660 [Hymenobacter arcticus]
MGYAALLGVGALGLTACPAPDQPAATAAKPHPVPAARVPAPAPLTAPQQLGKTGFYLALPPGFALKATNGPDFLVYYFAPADTTVQADFSGGLYLGGHPQGDEGDTTGGCRVRRVAVTLLGHPATFTIHRCATGYTVNSVFASHSGRGWDAQVNAFGEAKSAAGLRQLLAIFATLRRQPAAGKPAAAAN